MQAQKSVMDDSKWRKLKKHVGEGKERKVQRKGSGLYFTEFETSDSADEDIPKTDVETGISQLQKQRKRMNDEEAAMRKVISTIIEASCRRNRAMADDATDDAQDVIDMLIEAKSPGQRFLSEEQKDKLRNLYRHYKSM